MARLRVTAEDAQRFANLALDSTNVELDEVPVGFGNHNWRVRTPSGHFIMKIASADLAPKWTAAAVGARQAIACGLPVSPIRSSQIIDGHIVRVFDWSDGEPASTLDGRPKAQQRLGAELGAALALLHSHELESFGSRLDGSAPTFPTWAAYVTHRLGQIQARAEDNGGPEPSLRSQATSAISALADEVSPYCRAVVCHRDLHADNLLVDDAGSLVAILDWDMPEAWDPAGDWFKLELMLFPLLPDTADRMRRSYEEVLETGEAWAERKRLVQMIECLNIVANTPNQTADFSAFGVEGLGRLLATSR